MDKEKIGEFELNKIYCMDCLEGLKKLPDNSVDSIVTDPPYGLVFMGKEWDKDVPGEDVWRECLRVLKPGAHLLSFSGTRTYHKMTYAVEKAGFEIRDMISWLYGSGFPKSLNIGKQIDKIQGNEREIVGKNPNSRTTENDDVLFKASMGNKPYITKGNSQWEGWGTALKPAQECIVVARKPLSEKNVALNVLKWGTGGINIDACRIEYESEKDKSSAIPQGRITTKSSLRGVGAVVGGINDYEINRDEWKNKMQGRFPANIILDEEAGKLLDKQSGVSKSKKTKMGRGFDNSEVYGTGDLKFSSVRGHNDKGGASRFFYCAKSSRSERNYGITTSTIKLIKPSDLDILWKEENIELVTLIQKDILGLIEPLNIEECGENIMVKCQKANLSTIKTEINKITELKTWNSLTHSLTKEYILNVFSKKENGGKNAKFVESLNQLMIKTGISQEKVGLVMEDVKNAIYKLLLILKENEENWEEDKCSHPTVKPIKLMRYLIKLVTQKKGICLDPFIGSGTTGIACKLEEIRFIGFEISEEYCKIANKRLSQQTLF